MDTRESSAPLLGLFSIICKHVYWYIYVQQISGERLQDHWSSGFSGCNLNHTYFFIWPNTKVLISCCTADLRLCFHIGKIRFSDDAAHMIRYKHNKKSSEAFTKLALKVSY